MYALKSKLNKNEKALRREDVISEVDDKFGILYQQIADMATEQASFNQRIKYDQDKLKEPLEVEISKIRKESDIMMRELERTQHANRELIQNKSTFVTSQTPSVKLQTFIHPSTSVSSSRANRMHKSTMLVENNFNRSKPKNRHSTPSTSHVPLNRLKKFKIEKKQKDENVPDFSYLIKESLQRRSKNKSVMSIS